MPASLLVRTVVAVGVFAAVSAPGMAAPQTSDAKGALIAPRDGARLPARPVTVILRDAKRVIDPVARLNGRRVSKRFAAPRRGRRRLVLTAAEGLRHGRNRVVVRFGIRGLRRTRSATFRVSTRRPLAGPRTAPIPAVVRQRTVLDGRRSRARPRRRRKLAVTGQRSGARRGAIAARHRPLKYRWRLRRAPRGSRYARRGAKFSTASALTAPRLRFRPDKRGTYVFRLRVDDGVLSAPADVEVDVLPTTPLVPVTAFADGGVQVGSVVYPASQAGGATMQLVVLDRATLELVSNTTILCPNGPGPGCTQQTENAVAGLDSDKLVIAAAVGPWAGQDTALAGIGVAPVGQAHEDMGGTFSSIGVPGMSPGEATQRAASGLFADPGLSGFFARDLHFNYAFTSGDPLEYRFDTVQGTLTVGGQTYPPGPPPVAGCGGGFHIWGFDPVEMGDPIEVQTVCTNVPGDPSQSSTQQNDLITLFTDPDPDLLFVASFGNPIYYVSFVQWGQLAGAFDQVGGFHHVLNSIASGPYTLVGPVDGQFAGGGVEGNGPRSPTSPGSSNSAPTSVTTTGRRPTTEASGTASAARSAGCSTRAARVSPGPTSRRCRTNS